MEKESQEARLSTLRVAQTELCIGNTDGSVHRQLSRGAVMFLTDRQVANEVIAKEIRVLLKKDLAETGENSDSN